MLSSNEAKTLWEGIERGPCSSHLAPDERQWIDLVKAVGNRSAPDMARLAEALLAKPSDLPAGHRQYLMAAGMAGDLPQGQHPQGRAPGDRHSKEARTTRGVGPETLFAPAFRIKKPRR